ncbi:MAG TPA: TonB-dependent receptor [Candidatus Eisenbacteria bacterium]
MRTVLLAGALLAAGSLVRSPGTARAGTEEFSTFDVVAQEEDDESLLDHVLARPPVEWRDEWERSPQAIRTAQGCLTSGQWFIATQLKLRAPLGEHASFGLDLRQDDSDISSYQYVDFSFRFPTRWGAPGALFRPLFDKSLQDFALTWETGSDTAAFQLQTAFAFEDAFNNLWEFRQTRVGNHAEPYERHPYEPGLRLVARGGSLRAEIGGRYLTPSRKRIRVDPATRLDQRFTLWGTLGWASFEVRALGITWEAQGANQQTRRSEWLSDGSPRTHDFQRQWSAEAAARRHWTARLTTEARWDYQERFLGAEPTASPSAFSAVDRVLQLEADYALGPVWSARVGALHDRITVGQVGRPRFTTYGTRVESRAYVGLEARFGKVSVSAVEGVELDPEPYEVWGVHDKAFLQLQTTF